MNVNLLNKVESGYMRNDANSFAVGDTVKVYNIIREGEKSRVQIFRGVVIAKKGSGTRASFTVRKISDGIGVEKIFPTHSPNVQKIEVVRTGKVRRAKLYFLRDRVGKAALKVKSGRDLVVEMGTSEAPAEAAAAPTEAGEEK